MFAKLEILWRASIDAFNLIESWIGRHPRLTLVLWLLSLVAVAAGF